MNHWIVNMAEVELTNFEVSLQNLMTALEVSNHDEAKHQIKELHPGEIARLLEAIQPKDSSYLAWDRNFNAR